MGYRHTLTLAALLAGLVLAGCDGGDGGDGGDGSQANPAGNDDAAAPDASMDGPASDRTGADETGSAAKSQTAPDAGGDAGSADPSASSAYPQADTPRQAVLNLADAFEAGDADAFMRVVHQAEAHPNLARSVFHFGHAATTVRDAVVDLHGRAGLNLLDEQQALRLPYPLGRSDWRDRLTIHEVGEDRAEARIADDGGESTPLPLVRTDGRWRVDLFAAMEARTEAQIEKARQSMQALAGELDTLRKEITDAGLSLEQIGRAWGERLNDRITEGRRWLADVIAPDATDAPDAEKPGREPGQ